MYPRNSGPALASMGYGPFKDFRATEIPGGEDIQWLHTDPQPTEQDVIDHLASQAFADWIQENDRVLGDPVLVQRREADEFLDSMKGQPIRAVMEAMLDEINILRAAATPPLTPRIKGSLNSKAKQKNRDGDADT